MRSSTAAVLLACSAVLMTGCTICNPDAGHQYVLIRHPYFFGHGGVEPEPVNPGLSYAALSTDYVDVYMQPEIHEQRFADLMTSDGVPITLDCVDRTQVRDSVQLISKFGPHWYANNIEREFANQIRMEVRQHGLNETAINTTAVNDIQKHIKDAMQVYTSRIGIPVDVTDVLVLKAMPPDAVENQRVETAAEQQRAITEAQRKLAEDARKAAEQSRAEADNAYRNSMSMSPEQFIELQRIAMQRDACVRSHANCIFLMGKAEPLVNVGK